VDVALKQANIPSVDNKINQQSVDTAEPEDKGNLVQRIFQSEKNKDEEMKVFCFQRQLNLRINSVVPKILGHLFSMYNFIFLKECF
jgi:hypothetical protein